jgi:hypothetical protein
MAKCIPCAKMSQSDKDVIDYYKHLYKKYGKEYYVYRLASIEPVKFVKKEHFNQIFQTQIKPNFDNGADYFFIAEFH